MITDKRLIFNILNEKLCWCFPRVFEFQLQFNPRPRATIQVTCILLGSIHKTLI